MSTLQFKFLPSHFFISKLPTDEVGSILILNLTSGIMFAQAFKLSLKGDGLLESKTHPADSITTGAPGSLDPKTLKYTELLSLLFAVTFT